MKHIVFTTLLVITFLSAFSQNKCASCDSAKIKSMTEYDYEAYKYYRKNCMIRDTIFYDKLVQLTMDTKSKSYTVNEKNYCGIYVSTTTYNRDSVMISGYAVDKQDTIYLAVSDQEQQMKAIATEAMMQLKKIVVFPKGERKKGNSGKVYTTFVLNEQGIPENAYVIKGQGKGLNEEAIRAINLLKLTPVMHQGRIVKFRMNFPINFML
jgi:TonB family protein